MKYFLVLLSIAFLAVVLTEAGHRDRHDHHHNRHRDRHGHRHGCRPRPCICNGTEPVVNGTSEDENGVTGENSSSSEESSEENQNGPAGEQQNSSSSSEEHNHDHHRHHHDKKKCHRHRPQPCECPQTTTNPTIATEPVNE